MPSEFLNTRWISSDELMRLYPPLPEIGSHDSVVYVQAGERESLEASELRRHLVNRYDEKGNLIGMMPLGSQ